MTTLLYPCFGGQTCGEVSIRSLPVSGGRGLAFAVATGRGSDYLIFSDDTSLKRFGPYQSRGMVAGVRTSSDGDVLTRFEWKT